MLFATRCPVCDARGPAPCPACAAELRPAPALPPPPGLDRCAAVLIYAGTGRELVARLKYRNRRAPLDRLAAAMAERVLAEPDVVTWAPTTRSRWRRRGYDQAELLARAVARRLGRPCRRLLARLPGPAQTGLSLTQRRVAPDRAATARARRRRRGHQRRHVVRRGPRSARSRRGRGRRGRSGANPPQARVGSGRHPEK